MDQPVTTGREAELGALAAHGHSKPLARELDAARELYMLAGASFTDARLRAARLRRLSTALGVSATALAALAAVTVIPQDVAAWVTGISAGLAALISGLRTAFNPTERARVAEGLSLRWRRLADDVDVEVRAAEDEVAALRDVPEELVANRIRELRERLEDRLTPLRDRRDSLALEQAGSSETVLERAERAFKTAEAHERQVTESVVHLSLTFVRGLRDDMAAAAEGSARRMLSGAVDTEGVDRVVRDITVELHRRLGERQWQFATTLRAAAPEAFGDRPAVSARPSREERDEGLAASGYRLVRPD
jgi:hypothetical protein